MAIEQPTAIDVGQCLKKGLVGTLGIVPGTIAAHPFDVIKIRMQTAGDPFKLAMQSIAKGRGMTAFYRGLGSAIQQKMITCGPMFLVSETCTQGMQLSGMTRGQACFAGSAVSGYITGSVAAIAEYRKVLVSQNVPCAHGGSWSYAVILRHSGTHGLHIFRRLNGAGIRNGIFDSTFFGCQHLYQQKGMTPGASYGLAAATAVLMGYSLDIAVKKQMVVPPEKVPRGMLAIIHDLYQGPSLWRALLRAHNGMSPKIVEFTINYSTIGLSSVYIVYMLNTLVSSMRSNLGRE